MASRRRRTRAKSKKAGRDPQERERGLASLAFMRSEGLSLTRAARKAGTTAATVRKYVGSTLTRNARGHYKPKRFDRLTRELRFTTRNGPIHLKVRDSRAASLVAHHAAAVRIFLRTGRLDVLEPFQGKSIRAGGTTHPFLTDPDLLERLAYSGESFERLYVQRS